jgi:hypothetical protein
MPHDAPVTYAVLWSENDGPEFAGKLSLDSGRVVLSGTAAGQPSTHRDVLYTDVADVYLERTAPPRHTWKPSLVLVTRDGDEVAIGSLEGVGALHELAEQVASARGKTAA